ncbi:Protein MRPS-26 [Aphelenchoides avenae]|nr:Protein MRPS-26 [Aphelenchus avenae]
MLGHNRLLLGKFHENLICNVRYMRRRPPKQGKPPILPPATSKLYRVVNPEWQKPEDVRELLWRRHVYNNAVVSLRQVFRQEIEAKERAGLGIEGLKQQEKVELDRLIALNEQRNEDGARHRWVRRKRSLRRCTGFRAIREKEAFEQLKAETLESIEHALTSEQRNAEERTREVLELVEESANFVTKENLDEKLREALEKPVVYDYVIDLNGSQYHNPLPQKYLEGTPTRQKGRIYDKTLGTPVSPPPVAASEGAS